MNTQAENVSRNCVTHIALVVVLLLVFGLLLCPVVTSRPGNSNAYFLMVGLLSCPLSLMSRSRLLILLSAVLILMGLRVFVGM